MITEQSREELLKILKDVYNKELVKTFHKDVLIKDCPDILLVNWTNKMTGKQYDLEILKQYGVMHQNWTHEPIYLKDRGEFLNMREKGYNVKPKLSMSNLQ